MAKNIFEKIWDTHVVVEEPGHPVVLAVDLLLLHEVTSAQAFDNLNSRGIKVFAPERCVATLDHSIPTRQDRWIIYDESARTQVERMRTNAKEHGIRLFDFDSGKQGIVHVIGPELGLTQPGMTICCGDSHTSTHGAFGALAFGIGTSEVGHVLATSCILQRKPKSMLVRIDGSFQKGVFPKDAILKLIATIGVGGANGHVIEYAGNAISAMSMDQRMTVCNMSIECGARAGLVAPDQTTLRYIEGREEAPKGAAWQKAVEKWQNLASDPDATYDKECAINVSVLRPMVTWGTNPAQGICIDEKIPRPEEVKPEERLNAQKALDYIGLKGGEKIEGTALDYAFAGSCTNGRIEDLRIIAKILKGRKVASTTKMLIVPGSEAVLAEAKQEKLDMIFHEAGAELRNPGCSMCLGMNDDLVPPGKRCISSSNRNFVGRQGPGSRTHLASPATVAASAIAGVITSPESYL